MLRLNCPEPTLLGKVHVFRCKIIFKKLTKRLTHPLILLPLHWLHLTRKKKDKWKRKHNYSINILIMLYQTPAELENGSDNGPIIYLACFLTRLWKLTPAKTLLNMKNIKYWQKGRWLILLILYYSHVFSIVISGVIHTHHHNYYCWSIASLSAMSELSLSQRRFRYHGYSLHYNAVFLTSLKVRSLLKIYLTFSLGGNGLQHSIVGRPLVVHNFCS